MPARLPCPPLAPRRLQGFTLVEALVALLVLSIGLLGLAGLQLFSLQSAHSAYQRTVASIMAMDAGERLWLAAATGVADPESVQGPWRGHWQHDPDAPERVGLPEAGDSALNCDASGCTVRIQWVDGRFEEEGSGGPAFEYALQPPSAWLP
ncbi:MULTISPECIES: type IV pilus modification protein PilV [unclassified Ectothiorhodospira]|uniref:type IV pilus modification protein PilV n=1 Tax=unclassified Ectothiorhodospira TaxID=2684909 RepID=UPI001EE7FB1F|nr:MULTISPECIES: type IV pilus modification protein PilV [unclassified Ectothiorhodospira]MCG5515318.1 type IV pilus modification protein PilV [Ectothiorhodospira sp. 9100]MCG5519401.1 type IV pilus modification protein PilV [Ectothiorhodospira sp. 9905]